MQMSHRLLFASAAMLIVHVAACRYPGCDRSMLVPNCIFRSNGAAILLSNKRKDSW